MQRPQLFDERHLLRHRPAGLLQTIQHVAQHGRELQGGAFCDAGVLNAPFCDGIEGVEEEMWVELTPHRQQPRHLQLVGECRVMLSLGMQRRF